VGFSTPVLYLVCRPVAYHGSIDGAIEQCG